MPASLASQPGFIVWNRDASGADEIYADGCASIEWNVPITESTLFNVGSVAKQITAFLVLQGARNSLFELDDPLSRHLPNFHMPDVTVRELLQHHGGVRDAESMLSLAGLRDLDHYTAEDLIEVAHLQRDRAVPPGTFLYSNTGYLLAAKILQLGFDQDIQTIAEELLFRSAGMDGARYRLRPTEVIRQSASSYTRTAAGGWERCAYPVAIPGPGSLWCSLDHLRSWLEVLSGEWPHNQPPTAVAPLPAVVSDRPNLRYGAGIYADPGYDTVFHEGHEHGFSAAVFAGRHGDQIIVLSNRSDLDAARLAAALRIRQRASEPAHLAEITRRIMNDPHTPNPVTVVQDDAGDVRRTGQDVTMYRCREAVGTVGLSAEDADVVLHRRAVKLRLHANINDPCRFDGPGLSIRLPRARSDSRPLERFTLDLARAPGLEYVRLDGPQWRRSG